MHLQGAGQQETVDSQLPLPVCPVVCPSLSRISTPFLSACATAKRNLAKLQART